MNQNKITVNMSRLLGFALISLIILGFVSCKKDEGSNDKTPPGKLTIKETIPTHGGAKIVYILPQDEDVLFVKAEYTTTLGEEVFKASSFYNDTIEIDGFNDTLPQLVQLYVVDRNDNHSEVVETQVAPLKSYIHLVQESIEVKPMFGGVKISWENDSGKLVHVKLFINSVYGYDSVIISSNIKSYSENFRGMDSVYYEFDSKVKDKYENITGQKFVAKVKPQFEQKIKKDSWTLVNDLSIDGNAYEGVTENFWDDIIDTESNPDDNSYFLIEKGANGGSFNYPMDIVIDLNKKAVLNRFQVWQRAFWYPGNNDNTSNEPYYYQAENLRAFDIYVSNDKVEWILVGEFDIGDPKDEDGNISQEKIQEAQDGHEFILENTTEPFRFFKFSITSTFGSEDIFSGSEITLFGLDKVEE